MSTDSLELSLQKAIKSYKFEASLITTFNIYFPFYEEVILRNLIASGSRHNILLMDQGQLAICMATPSLRPRRAGFDYTLIPVKCSGAFHPKIMCLFDRRKAEIFIGSHNMTFSGFGLNRELTNHVRVTAGKTQEGTHFAKQVFQLVKTWVATSEIPQDQNQKNLESLSQMAPWLNRPANESESDAAFFGTQPSGETIWQQVQKDLPSNIRHIKILSPFFDRKLDFLTTLLSESDCEQITVGIAPETVDIKRVSDLDGRIVFVDASGVYKKQSYLHAKAYLFEDYQDNCWLLTGSANASRPAWLETAETGNVEAMVLRYGKSAKSDAYKLGLSTLDRLSPISEKQWQAITERTLVDNDANDTTQDTVHTGIAVIEHGQLIIPAKQIGQESTSHVHLYNAQNILLEEISSFHTDNERIIIDLSKSKQNQLEIRFVKVTTNIKEHLFIVQHQDRINKKLISSRQAQFRASLDSLHSRNPDIESLISTVEKVIFDNPPDVPQEYKRDKKASSKSDQNNEEGGERVLESLAVHLDETSTEKKRVRLMKSGDLGHLLDVLIHHLGIGILKPPVVDGDTTDMLGRNEEEQVGADDDLDDEDQSQFLLDPSEIIKTCQIKVRNLVSRILKQMEKAATDDEANHILPIVQLVAVLALLRELRLLDKKADWIPPGHTLFPIKQRERLLTESTKLLFGSAFMLYHKALFDLTDEPSDEISRLRGLLLWLARDSDQDIQTRFKLIESKKEERSRLINRYIMLQILTSASYDNLAVEEAYKSVLATTRPHQKQQSIEWHREHIKWGTTVLENALYPKHNIPMKAGDIVIRERSNIVLFSVTTRSSSEYTHIIDLSEKDNEKLYYTRAIGKLDLPESLLASR